LNYINKKIYELEKDLEKKMIKKKILELIPKLNKANCSEESMKKIKDSLIENIK
jgi:hypothetical protein